MVATSGGRARSRRLRGVVAVALVGAALLLQFACRETGGGPQPETEANPDDLAALIDEFVKAAMEAQPAWAARSGRHEYDGRLPDWSRSGLESWIATLDDFAARAEALATGPEEDLRRRQLLAVIERRLFWLRDAGWPARSIGYYLEDLDPSIYLQRPYAPTGQRMVAYSMFAAALPGALDQLTRHLDRPQPRSHRAFMAAALRDLGKHMRREAASQFRAVEEPELWRRFERLNARAVAALRLAETRFAEDFAKAPVEGYELGEELLRQMLRVSTGGLELDLADLEAAGWQEVERGASALAAACSLLGAASSAECRELLDPGEVAPKYLRAEAVVPRQLFELKRLAGQLGLVDASEEPNVRVTTGPALVFREAVSIELPGPFEAPFPAVLTIANGEPTGSPDSAEAGTARSARRLLAVARETWPGRLLQRLRAGRTEDALTSAFPDPLLESGWAQYATELASEQAIAAADAMGRAVAGQETVLSGLRLAVTLGLHSGRVEIEEAERLFEERGMLDAAGARAEASRCAREPERLLAPLGALAIRRLQEDWLAMRGLRGRQAEQAFHGELLALSGYSLAAVRELLVPGVGGSPY